MTNKVRDRDPWGLEMVRTNVAPSTRRTHTPPRLYVWGNRAAWALAALCVPFLLYAALSAGPSARLIAQEQRRQEIERENAAFCEKYGMPLGSPQHARCAADLMEIRAREDERTAAEVRELF
jgi:hypothetical protein